MLEIIQRSDLYSLENMAFFVSVVEYVRFDSVLFTCHLDLQDCMGKEGLPQVLLGLGLWAVYAIYSWACQHEVTQVFSAQLIHQLLMALQSTNCRQRMLAQHASNG